MPGRFRHHVFICTHRRPAGGKPSCGSRGSGELIARLQAAVAANPDLIGTVAITASGCLGPCFDGPNVVIYPDGVWYAEVSPDDAAELVIEHLVAGRVVDRLVYHWPDDDDEEEGASAGD